MPPHASTLPSRTNSRPSRFQKPGSTSSASDTTRTTVASTSDCEPSSSLRSLSSSQQSAAAGLYAPPQSLAPITNGASRFQKAGSISSASDSTTNTIASSTNTDSAFSVSLRSLNRTQQSATTGFYAPPPSLASITASTSRFSRFQKSAVKPSAAETTITTTIASSTGSEFAGSQFNGESLNTGSYASSSLVSEDAHFDDIHSAACAIAQDWTVNSSLSIVEKEIEPTIAAEIPEEVYLPPRFSDDYFAELEEKKMAAEGYLYGRQQRSAIGLAWILASRGPSKMFTPENQDIFRRCMITTIMKITKLDDDVVKGRVANMYLDYVETAYGLSPTPCPAPTIFAS